MKLFHTEKGQEVVYVQMQDIMYLEHETEIPIPPSIVKKVFNGVCIVTDENRFDFVKFEEDNDVKFFKQQEFIIDYAQYKDLSDEQLEAEGKKYVDKANQIAEKWNQMSQSERKQNLNILQEYNNVDYILKFISEIDDINHNVRKMPFPKFVETK